MDSASRKRERVIAALEHREADRVPVGEFFWSSFVRRAASTLGRAGAFDPYRHWDLDLIVVTPNMDPRIEPVRVIEERDDRKVVRTGFGATIELRQHCPMPRFLAFETTTLDALESLKLDDPADPRRYFDAIDDQINAVGDALNLDLPPFAERVRSAAREFCVFGSVCEPHEFLWRVTGTENLLMMIGEDPDRLARSIERAGDFLEGIARAQIRAADGALTGLYIWGDVAYDRGMLFSPEYWRDAYKPQVARLCRVAREAGLKTIYHGCGNASAIFEDLIDAGVDAYNPLEAKAGLDVVSLRQQFGRRWSFNGNIDVRVLGTNDRERVRREVLRKLDAARGGGYIFQSDHSVPGTVAPETYDYAIELVRTHGVYPLAEKTEGH